MFYFTKKKNSAWSLRQSFETHIQYVSMWQVLVTGNDQVNDDEFGVLPGW